MAVLPTETMIRVNGVFVPAQVLYRDGGAFTPRVLSLIGDEPVAPPGILGGVGGPSLSLALYPITPPVTEGDWYIDPQAATNGSGTLASPANNFEQFISGSTIQPGDTVLVRNGTINLTGRIRRTREWSSTVRIMGYGDERPILNSAGVASGQAALELSGMREHWKNFYIRGNSGLGRGIFINGTQYRIDSMWVSHRLGDGMYVGNFGSGAGHNHFQDVAVWRLGDGSSQDTNVADGIAFTATKGTVTLNNTIARAFVANGPDDGIDFFRARGTRVYDSVVYRSGRYWNNNLAGDGVGFKMGGADSDAGDNYVFGGLAALCRGVGLTHNRALNTSNTNPNILMKHVTSVGNGSRGIDLGGDTGLEKNRLFDAIMNGNGNDTPYVGPNAQQLRTTDTLSITNPQFVNPSEHDYSLAAGSPCIGVGEGGSNLGASEFALALYKEWRGLDLT